MRDLLRRLREFDLRAVRYPLPDDEDALAANNGVFRLRKHFDELEAALMSWSHNLSSLYFDHVRELAMNIG